MEHEPATKRPAALAERERRLDSLLEVLRRHRARADQLYAPGSLEHRRRVAANDAVRQHLETELAQLRSGPAEPGSGVAAGRPIMVGQLLLATRKR
jgi:hypothetical protein